MFADVMAYFEYRAGNRKTVELSKFEQVEGQRAGTVNYNHLPAQVRDFLQQVGKDNTSGTN